MRRAGEFYRDFDARVEAERAVLTRARRAAGRRRRAAAGVRRRARGRHPVDRDRQLHLGLDLRGLRPERPRLSRPRRPDPRGVRAGRPVRAPADVGRLRDGARRSVTRDLPLVARRSVARPDGDAEGARPARATARSCCSRSAATACKSLAPQAFDAFGDDFVAVADRPPGDVRGGARQPARRGRVRRAGAVRRRAGATRTWWRRWTSSRPSPATASSPSARRNDTAILYTSRGHFVEYEVLVRGDAALRALGVHPAGRRLRRRLAAVPRTAARAAGAAARRRVGREHVAAIVLERTS